MHARAQVQPRQPEAADEHTVRVHRGRSRAAIATASLGFGITLLVTAPLFLTDRAFWDDWTNSLWILDAAESPGTPSLFVHNERLGVFYPIFSFYGGPLYAAGKLLGVVLGGKPMVAYLLMWIGCTLAAYCAVYGIARRCCVPERTAHLPAICLVTAPYFLTNIFGRGAFSEFVATSAIPIVVYGVAALLVDVVPGRLAVVSVAVGVWLLTGSHMITLLLGPIFLVLVGIGIVGTSPRSLLPWLALHRHRVRTVAIIAVTAVAVNAWYLVPAVFLQGQTRAASALAFDVGRSAVLSRPELVFSALRRVPALSTTPGLFLQAQVVPLAWAAVVLALGRRRSRRGLPWPFVLWLLVLLGAVLVLVTSDWAWDFVPAVFSFVQFPYRLLTYANFLVVALVIAAVPRLIRFRHPLREMLAAVALVAVLFALAGAVWQGWTTESRGHRRETALVGEATVPATWYDEGGYRDGSLSVIAVPDDRRATIDPDLVRGDRFVGELELPPGHEPIATNIGAGLGFVTVKGLDVVGRTDDGFLVVQRPVGPEEPVTIEVEPRRFGHGWWGMLVSALAVHLLLNAPLVRWARRLDAGR